MDQPPLPPVLSTPELPTGVRAHPASRIIGLIVLALMIIGLAVGGEVYLLAKPKPSSTPAIVTVAPSSIAIIESTNPFLDSPTPYVQPSSTVLLSPTPGLIPTPVTGSSEDLKYTMVKNAVSGADFPQITSFYNPTVMASVNDQLEKYAEGLRCDPNDPYVAAVFTKTSYSSKAEVTFNSRDAFSVHVTKNVNCGVEPYQTEDGLTFDMRTGSRLAFYDLFLLVGKQQDQLLTLLFSAQINQPIVVLKNGQNCRAAYDITQMHEREFVFNITPNGLRVTPLFSSMQSMCMATVEMPLTKLASFAPANSLITQLLKAARYVVTPTVTPVFQTTPSITPAPVESL